MTTAVAAAQRWEDMPAQEVAPGIVRRYLTTSKVTIARFAIARGAVVPAHKHEQEQVSCVLSGALRFRCGDREMTLRGGETVQIPSWVEHSVVALEDTDVIDVFTPVRQDWVDGTDTYFRK